MTVSKKNTKKSARQAVAMNKPVSKDSKQVKSNEPGSVQEQLRSFEKRFKPGSSEELSNQLPVYKQGDLDNSIKNRQSSGENHQDGSSEYANSLVYALAAATQPVLLDESSKLPEAKPERVANNSPGFLSDQYFYYSENRPVGSSIARISLDKEVDIESYVFTSSGINISDDGYYQIDNEGVISLTLLGVLSQANDCNEGANRIQHNITLVDTSGNSCSADVVFNIVDEKSKSRQKESRVNQQISSSGNSAGKVKNVGARAKVAGNVLSADGESDKRKSKKMKTGAAVNQYSLQFPLFEFSRDKNRTRDESLILGLEHETDDRFDQLIITSELRDRSLSLAISIKHVVTASNLPCNFSLTRIDGGSLPGWLRVNQKDGELSGIVPGGLKNISVRVQCGCTDKMSAVRFITVDLNTGGVQELQSLEPANNAGAPLFTEQLEANVQAIGLDTKILINEFNF